MEWLTIALVPYHSNLINLTTIVTFEYREKIASNKEVGMSLKFVFERRNFILNTPGLTHRFVRLIYQSDLFELNRTIKIRLILLIELYFFTKIVRIRLIATLFN